MTLQEALETIVKKGKKEPDPYFEAKATGKNGGIAELETDKVSVFANWMTFVIGNVEYDDVTINSYGKKNYTLVLSRSRSNGFEVVTLEEDNETETEDA